MNILVINAGSSSVKYQLIEMTQTKVIAKGGIERIGIEGSNLEHKPNGKDKIVIETPIADHTQAIAMVLDALTDKDHGVIKSMDEIGAVGHRVVHGSEFFSSGVIVDDKVLGQIQECAELAPLHNPASLMGIKACQKIMPGTPMVTVFDTAFHQTMPKNAYLYGLSYEAYEKFRVRKYGFHGTSHKFVAERYAEITGKKIEDLKLITCHLGNGSSVCAVDGGKSVDTSMGFTPLEGLVMGTRSGDIDPAIVPFLMNKMHMNLDETITYLNKQCGVWGLSGESSDFRDLWKASGKGIERATVALQVFCYRLKKFIGSYAAAMGGVDAIIFTAGIGENDYLVREWSVEGLQFLGAIIDKPLNEEFEHVRGNDVKLSTEDSTVDIWCIPTNEELAIAKETYALCK
ncbi:MAG: acetate kinase [Clostridia bacterium]|jgi:acetate kinase|nr:acetate kinase [Clostridia bacterium]MBT7121424.1 acetate kinase [Clostridia bacterium]